MPLPAAPRRPALALALAGLSGLALGPFLPRPLLAALGALGVAAALDGSLRSEPGPRRRASATAGLLLAAGALFALRAGAAHERERALLGLPEPTAGACALSGQVLEPLRPTPWPGRRRFAFRPDRGAPVEVELDPGEVVGRPLRPGDRVRLLGRFLASPGLERRAALARRGLAGRFSASGAVLLAPGGGVQASLARVRAGLTALLAGAVAPSRLPFFQRVVLGEPAPLGPALQEAFRRTGSAHLLSLSGLHVALLAGLAGLALRPLPLRRAPRLTLLATLLLLYPALCGARAPTLRAAGAGLLLALAPSRGDGWNRLAAAFLGVALLHPAAPREVGCQLSFGTVAALLLLRPPRRDARPGAARLLVRPLTPFLASAPLLLLTLGQVPWVGLVLGPPLVALFALTLGLAVVGLLVGTLAAPLGWPLLRAADAGAAVLLELVQRAAAWPWAASAPGTPPAWIGVLAGGAVGLLALRRERQARP